MKILVNFYIRKMERIVMRGSSRKSCTAESREGRLEGVRGGHADGSLRTTVMKITAEDGKGSNTAVDCEGQKTTSKRRGNDETNSRRLHPV